MSCSNQLPYSSLTYDPRCALDIDPATQECTTCGDPCVVQCDICDGFACEEHATCRGVNVCQRCARWRVIQFYLMCDTVSRAEHNVENFLNNALGHMAADRTLGLADFEARKYLINRFLSHGIWTWNKAA